MAKNKNKSKRQVHETITKPKTFAERFLNLPHQFDLRQEIIAGLTALLSTAYLFILVPRIFQSAYPGFAGIEYTIGLATIIAVIIANVAQSLWARLPYIFAPSLSTVLIVLPLIASIASDSPYILMAVFIIEGALFFILAILPLKKSILPSIPQNIRIAAIVGLGAILVMLGLQTSGIFGSIPVAGEAGKLVSTLQGQSNLIPAGGLQSILDTRIIVFLAGLIAVGYFAWIRSKAPAIWTIIITSLIGLIFVSEALNARVTAIPDGFMGFNGIMNLPDFGKLKDGFNFNTIGIFGKSALIAMGGILMVLVKDLFATSGISFGLARIEGRINDQDEDFDHSERLLQVTAGSKIVSSALGGMPVELVPESAIPVHAGGKTVLTPLFYAAGCVLLIFFLPFFRMIPGIAIAPVLIYTGITFIKNISDINWKSAIDAIPAIVVIFVSLVTANLAFGLMWGILIHLALRVAIWRFDDTPPGAWVLGVLAAAAFILFYIGL